MWQILVHALYSDYQYYGTNKIATISQWLGLDTKPQGAGAFWKKVALVTGALSLTTLGLYVYEYVNYYQAGNMIVICGIIHFYTMEIDPLFVLHVRPFAYLPFPLGAVALAYINYQYIQENYPQKLADAGL